MSSHVAPVVRRFAVGAAAALLLGSSLLVTAAASVPVLAAKGATGSVEVTNALHHDVSAPLRVLAAAAVAASSAHGPQPKTDRPLRSIPHGNPNRPDGALQGTAGPAGATTPGIGFAGVGNGDYGFVPNAAPPDTNGAVGTTQYVQWVNESFAVFNKATGAKLLGPVAGNTLWSGFGDRCATSNDGDPIAQFDKVAQRWVMTQFVVSSTPYLQCVAVSTTSDATGSWNRYSFNYGNTQFVDYPKLGVWPDPANNAYFISYNIFNNGTSFAGAKVCAFDRAKMMAGAQATQQCFQLSNLFGGLLPADFDGQTLPPAGSPGMFLNFTGNSLFLWRFHPDWTTITNTTLTGPFSVPGVATFSAACGGGTCIPQGGVSQKLDSLGDRLMYRLAYRNLGNHEALVVNHSVTAGASVGVRWYELRNAAGTTMAAATPVIYQQGTYAPDATFRWMGSAAMDHAGDIAVGYSGSSSSVFPYIAYASRAPGDALGTLSAETIVKAGGGSQSGAGLSRWGDYSAMTVDPVDDCTFWYTTEYEKSTGAFNWSTWISSLKFPNCGVAQTAPAITSATGTTFTIGSPGSFTVTTTGSPAPSISESGALPGGVTLADNGNGTATLSGTPAAGSATSYSITITAANGVLPNATQSFTLTVNPAPQTAPAITSANATTFTIGTAGSFTVTTTGSPAPSISETGALPGGVTFFDNHNGTATLSGTPSTGSMGSYPIMFTATNGVTPDATQNFTLTVNSAVQALVVTTTSLPNGRKGAAYQSTQLAATGGATPYTWAIVSGAVPPGLSLSPAGIISGTPTKVGTFTFTVQVTDSSNQAATATLSIKITQH